jgi:hypothetical protein
MAGRTRCAGYPDVDVVVIIIPDGRRGNLSAQGILKTPDSTEHN